MGASTGLKPWEVYDMTERELECWFEGATVWKRQVLEWVAWTQANLINVHIPKGKSRVTVEKLLPRWAKRKPSDDDVDGERVDFDEAPSTDPKAEVARLKARTRRAIEAKRDRVFWASPQGQALAAGITTGESANQEADEE